MSSHRNRNHNPDPLHHLNTHRVDELLAVARTAGGMPHATAARAERVDAQGIDITVETPDGPARTRAEFLEPVLDYPAGIRVAFVRLARKARSDLAVDGTGGQDT